MRFSQTILKEACGDFGLGKLRRAHKLPSFVNAKYHLITDRGQLQVEERA